ncbi:MAG TPA: hypothetical protein DEQ27_01470 [Prevotella sp.]|nr:hypothetical protein [Prevotella sp.]
MKLSKYNFILEKEDNLLLYNCRSEKMTLLQPELYVLLLQEDIEGVRIKHPTFYDYLVTGSVLNGFACYLSTSLKF